MLFCAFLCIGVMASLAFAQTPSGVVLDPYKSREITQTWNYPEGARTYQQLRLTNGDSQAGLILGKVDGVNAIWSSGTVPTGANTLFSMSRPDSKALTTRAMLPAAVTINLDYYACKPNGRQMECRVK